MSGAGGVTAHATKSGSGAADDPTGWIADLALRTSVYPDACSDIRVRPGTRTTPEVCPSLNGAGGVAAQAAVSGRCAGGGTGLIDSARSDSRHLRQTPWYCRNADPDQSKFNRCNLSHIIFPPSHVVFCLSDLFPRQKYSGRANPALLRARRIFQCYGRGDRCSLVRDRWSGSSG